MMRAIARFLALAVLLMVLAGCGAAPSPTPAPTLTPLPPTETPTPGPTPYIPPTPTPGLPLGGAYIRPDQPFESALLPDHPAAFTFDELRQNVFTFALEPRDASLDIRLTLLDYTGLPLLVVDRAGPGAAETIPEVMLPATGRYELRVEATAGEGDVSGTMTPLVPTQRHGGGELDPLSGVSEVTAAGEFFARDVFHAYFIALAGGDVVTFEVAGEAEGVDPYFTLYDGQFRIVGRFDDEDGKDARSNDLLIPFDGLYTLFVGNKGAPGPYTVRVAEE